MINNFIRKILRYKSKGKVFVGLSGGVDSSVAAALLKKEGYDVTGVFIKGWHPDFMPCPWEEDRRDAMRVAASLDIPFKTLNLEKEYEEGVASYMIDEYKKGRTPNPDVMCNKIIKFGIFLDKAKEMGADFIATGHYVRLKKDEKTNEMKFLSGVDKNKDQSYFLWTLRQDQLRYSLFPVGDYEKKEIRKIAKKYNLPTAEKKDSQGICFMGQVEMKDFLKHYIKNKKGDILDKKGNIIGNHEGAYFYTLGQRHGFEITKKGIDDKPYYVVDKDIEKNTLVVDHSKINKESQNNIEIEGLNWVSGESPDLKSKYQARIRYRQPLQNCQIVEDDNGVIRILFNKPQEAVTPGQSLVLYQGEECLGGGVIK